MSDLSTHCSVSVIIPVYNGARYLVAAVESVRLQFHERLEIIVVDDGSTDGSLDLANSIEGVRSFRQSNGGSAAARSRGIMEARGSILGFLDADDLWVKDKLALQLPLLDTRLDIQLVAGRVEEFCEEVGLTSSSRLQRRSGDRAYTMGALLMRREDFLRVGLLDEKLRFGEFMDWRSRALHAGYLEHVLPEVVLRRRLHDRNTTLRATDSRPDYMATIKAHLARVRSTRGDASQKKGSGP